MIATTRSRFGGAGFLVKEPPRSTRVWSLLLPRGAQFCQLAGVVAAAIAFEAIAGREGHGPHTLLLPSFVQFRSDRQRAMMVMQARYRESGPGRFLVAWEPSLTPDAD